MRTPAYRAEAVRRRAKDNGEAGRQLGKDDGEAKTTARQGGRVSRLRTDVGGGVGFATPLLGRGARDEAMRQRTWWSASCSEVFTSALGCACSAWGSAGGWFGGAPAGGSAMVARDTTACPRAVLVFAVVMHDWPEVAP
ncbi:hypothetical protein GCM10010532_026070 [Dactylosporangium siamense]|uniref:Uncharacterized protein n=1 Tax=Dactylosporangium siamense TaxID=685454 RepID=A0A919PXF2_9ACTN|nr:hypothetical protein Dsi01nite_090620 [Dactylosporangium siamense]